MNLDFSKNCLPMALEQAPIFFLVGATSTGKTAIAHRIAEATGVSLLSIDSMQVYKKLDIGTAKPSLHERIRYRYGGIDLVDWKESFNVFLFIQWAKEYLSKELQQNRAILVVGGCGLYFRAMTRGLCAAPAADALLRKSLEKLDRKKLIELLIQIDPLAASAIDCSNPRRVIRAIEVKKCSGISIIEWQKKTTFPLVVPALAFWIDRPKPELEIRLRNRIQSMFEAGWEKETCMLLEEGGIGAIESCQAIGYRQIGQYLLQKEKNKVKLMEDILKEHCAYGKRQKTWFKRENSLSYCLLKNEQEECSFIKSYIEKINFFIRK
ncbi:tRNA (adenosine(37)-N6)-dimethylallyltransferase MiaA [Candidatus Methylacidiphilum fumarolicum]|nr:tRNA (adenosine(37)-N6)-dimethylallyltransferase MiaA [Candidatus Methylacidiphilum fumarolicum]MBW6414087.1 tRNA (adenosine(37)-N6)-dimethylallyltransferase MiaA [Candidatus Methylacidiphilum fumarolicum]TFE66436.1 tRNA (adenosine(37)-N6)-dimethylallyltransferase MiaA [Candidatus Methylacidiphilum fumarolicum]TFE75226.1 tRNA (adenosine(37)-N6)-dimethylallyltransferase MiaA [Candidatus Methylacidiphilum fumarolicum]TFE76162.1 tRNA (adenosine(37)-N6)-dimethylallyltransferase MiaA [Candidatus 